MKLTTGVWRMFFAPGTRPPVEAICMHVRPRRRVRLIVLPRCEYYYHHRYCTRRITRRATDMMYTRRDKNNDKEKTAAIRRDRVDIDRRLVRPRGPLFLHLFFLILPPARAKQTESPLVRDNDVFATCFPCSAIVSRETQSDISFRLLFVLSTPLSGLYGNLIARGSTAKLRTDKTKQIWTTTVGQTIDLHGTPQAIRANKLIVYCRLIRLFFRKGFKCKICHYLPIVI